MTDARSLERRIVIPFHDHLGLTFLPTVDGVGGAVIPDATYLTNHFGIVHGSALFAVGEIGAARAVVSLLDGGGAGLRSITRKAEIRYLKPANGAITAEAAVQMDRAALYAALERDGKVRPVSVVRLKDASGLIVAELTVESHVSRASG